MKKLLLLFLLGSFAISCSSVKKSQKALNIGDYDQAIDIALNKLRNNKNRKGNQPLIYQLEEAYKRVTERDLEQISFLKKDGNPANLEIIYNTYLKLDRRQQLIKPLLPLYMVEENRNARFKFENYSNDIISTKNELSEHLYAQASEVLQQSRRKYDYRKAYDDFKYLDQINPGYRDINAKMEEAHFKGTDFVKVALYNDTDKVIPRRLESEMLNFNTYGINDMWTVYHSNPQDKIKYDYEMELAFKQINISPEQIREKEIIKEKRIKDGWKYLYDDDGNAVKDSLGNKIKVDKFRKVKCILYQFTQFKAVQVNGNVAFKDLNTKQVVNSYPLSSEFVFEHIYADYDGDKRALEDSYLKLIKVREVPFPSSEQMIYDAGEDLKQRLKNIISRHKFN
ncbi:hypothetical protein GWK08_07830 [Leptobacterium flavescens]|uniref:Lipoprotein n=1 Tax=Leptobacterium flavescens TaxID=472055 RepID=A0A6P0UR75_9FLAO|nr:hypothetical protein [Leptobacterium flavescens]NER13343.1 hypothetical protein [Leptobacterium flavescens]